jgi:hypothetical protein
MENFLSFFFLAIMAQLIRKKGNGIHTQCSKFLLSVCTGLCKTDPSSDPKGTLVCSSIRKSDKTEIEESIDIELRTNKYSNIPYQSDQSLPVQHLRKVLVLRRHVHTPWLSRQSTHHRTRCTFHQEIRMRDQRYTITQVYHWSYQQSCHNRNVIAMYHTGWHSSHKHQVVW